MGYRVRAQAKSQRNIISSFIGTISYLSIWIESKPIVWDSSRSITHETYMHKQREEMWIPRLETKGPHGLNRID